MMIDIHNHMLNNVDDGSDDFDLSLKQLTSARKEGITDIILTPHFIFNEISSRKSKNELAVRFEEFSKRIKEKLNINLYLGNELFIHESLDELLLSNEICTLANTSYVLVEFPFDKYDIEYDEYLYNLKISGYRVIIAHPERYKYVLSNFNFVDRWINEGYLLQCNQDGLKDSKSSKIIFSLIENGYCHFVATDSHSEKRPTTLINAYKLIEKRYGKKVAKKLFIENPSKLLNNERIDGMEKAKRKFFVL